MVVAPEALEAAALLKWPPLPSSWVRKRSPLTRTWRPFVHHQQGRPHAREHRSVTAAEGPTGAVCRPQSPSPLAAQDHHPCAECPGLHPQEAPTRAITDLTRELSLLEEQVWVAIKDQQGGNEWWAAPGPFLGARWTRTLLPTMGLLVEILVSPSPLALLYPTRRVCFIIVAEEDPAVGWSRGDFTAKDHQFSGGRGPVLKPPWDLVSEWTGPETPDISLWGWWEQTCPGQKLGTWGCQPASQAEESWEPMCFQESLLQKLQLLGLSASRRVGTPNRPTNSSP